MKKDFASDFGAFWNSGKDFWRGTPLYDFEYGVMEFRYPPTSAMLFQILYLLPLNTAAIIAAFFNYLLLCLSAYIIYKILEINHKSPSKKLIIFLSLLFSLRFVINNNNLIQTNILIFGLSVLGIYYIYKNKDVISALFFSLGIMIKLVPVVFFLILLFQKKFRVIGFIILFIILGISVSLLQRGPEKTVEDYRAWYHTFVVANVLTKDDSHISDHIQGIPAAIYRLTTPAQSGKYALFDLSSETKVIIESVAKFFVIIGAVTALFLNRLKKITTIPLEYSLAFLIIILCSGYAERAQMVVLFYCYTFIIYELLSEEHALWLKTIMWSLMTILAVMGRDILGKSFFVKAGMLSIETWIILFIYVGTLLLLYRGSCKSS